MSQVRTAATATNTIIVFVPGITGSELHCVEFGESYPQEPPNKTGEIWPHFARLGDFDEGLETSNCLAALKGNLGPVTVGDIVLRMFIREEGKVEVSKFYEDLVNRFSLLPPDGAGFTPCTYGAKSRSEIPGTGNLFLMFPYDWRADNSVTVDRLNEVLDALDMARGSQPGRSGGYQLFLLAHSMGGLICRCLLERSPDVRKKSWFSNLKGLVTLATPHLGSPDALAAITGQKKRYGFLGNIGIWHLANQWLSFFQLLPPPYYTFVIDSNGKDNHSIYEGTVYDLLTSSFPLGFGLASDKLIEAQSFFKKLNYGTANGGSESTPVPYHCFVGTGLETADEFVYNSSSWPVVTLPQRFYPKYGSSAGDGNVTEFSASYLETIEGVSVRQFREVKHEAMAYDHVVLSAIMEIVYPGKEYNEKAASP